MDARHKRTSQKREETVEYYRAVLAQKNQTIAQKDMEIDRLMLLLSKLGTDARRVMA